MKNIRNKSTKHSNKNKESKRKPGKKINKGRRKEAKKGGIKPAIKKQKFNKSKRNTQKLLKKSFNDRPAKDIFSVDKKYQRHNSQRKLLKKQQNKQEENIENNHMNNSLNNNKNANEYNNTTYNVTEENNSNILQKSQLFSMKVDDQLQLINQIGNKIQFSPQENIKQIENLLILCRANDVLVSAKALLTLSEVFSTTAPPRQIDLQEFARCKEVTLSKDQYNVIRFDHDFVTFYHRYITMLTEIESKIKRVNFGHDDSLYTGYRKYLLQCAINCFKSLWHFNFFKQLNELMFRFISDSECRKTIGEFLASNNLATLKAKIEIVACMGRLIKDKHQSTLPDSFIDTLNLIHINTSYLPKEQQTLRFKKKKLTKKLYREQAADHRKFKKQSEALQQNARRAADKARQKRKIRKQVNQQFAEGDGLLNNKQLVKQTSDILQGLFYIYFKIIVEKVDSKYFFSCLKGILKHCHLINIDLIRALTYNLASSFDSLRAVWQNNKSTEIMEKRLKVIFTAESIINGPLSLYAMDDVKITTALFKILRDINLSKEIVSRQCFQLIGSALEQTLIRRRQLSQQIVAAFVNELCDLLLRKQLPKTYLLQLLRLIASKYEKTIRMFECDNQGYGFNTYNSRTQNPQCANAIHTSVNARLQSLLSLNLSQKRKIKEYITRFIRQNFKPIDNTPTLAQLLTEDIQLYNFLNQSQ